MRLVSLVMWGAPTERTLSTVKNTIDRLAESECQVVALFGVSQLAWNYSNRIPVKECTSIDFDFVQLHGLCAGQLIIISSPMILDHLRNRSIPPIFPPLKAYIRNVLAMYVIGCPSYGLLFLIHAHPRLEGSLPDLNRSFIRSFERTIMGINLIVSLRCLLAVAVLCRMAPNRPLVIKRFLSIVRPRPSSRCRY